MKELVVNTQEDGFSSTKLTLREALLNKEPSSIIVDVPGIELIAPLEVKGDHTINGQGTVLCNYGIVDIINNVNISNIHFKNFHDDAIRIGDESFNYLPGKAVIHDCKFSIPDMGILEVDECISVLLNSTVEVNNCWFDNVGKVILCGSGSTPKEDNKEMKVYFHHNYINSCERRVPQARYGSFYFYNNIIDSWKYKGNWFWPFGEKARRLSFLSSVEDCLFYFNYNIINQKEPFYDGGLLNFINSNFSFGARKVLRVIGDCLISNRYNSYSSNLKPEIFTDFKASLPGLEEDFISNFKNIALTFKFLEKWGKS